MKPGKLCSPNHGIQSNKILFLYNDDVYVLFMSATIRSFHLWSPSSSSVICECGCKINREVMINRKCADSVVVIVAMCRDQPIELVPEQPNYKLTRTIRLKKTGKPG